MCYFRRRHHLHKHIIIKVALKLHALYLYRSDAENNNNFLELINLLILFSLSNKHEATIQKCV